MKQGLPLGQINQFKEGVTLTSSGGTISLLNRAPIPTAPKCSSTGCCPAMRNRYFKKPTVPTRCASIFPKTLSFPKIAD